MRAMIKRLAIELFAVCLILLLPAQLLGRIKRSSAARGEFKRSTGYPSGRTGYIIDHVVPLACGGADDPSNMQWQTRDEAKAKDRVELDCLARAPYRSRSYESRRAATKPVQVRGYHTRSGSYVAPHYRSRPSRRR